MSLGSRPLVPSRLAPGGVVAHGSRRAPRNLVGAYIALTKPRIIELLLITTVPTMILAEQGWPSWGLVLITLAGGTLAAGNSPGELTVTGNVIWGGGGSYDWEINSFPGVAGTNWDFLDIGGSLTIDATAGNRFIIDVISLLANNNPGAASGFDAFTNYSFAIATAAGGISNFDSSYFNILAGSFANSMNPAGATSAGSWGVTKSGNNVMLNYTAATIASAGATAIPEPGVSSLLVIAGTGLLAFRRRR